jgi:hypothetical protein
VPKGQLGEEPHHRPLLVVQRKLVQDGGVLGLDHAVQRLLELLHQLVLASGVERLQQLAVFAHELLEHLG